MTTRQPREQRPQTVMEIVGKEYVAPSMVRLYFGGPGFASFRANGFTDAYIKIWFAKPELGLEPPYVIPELRETLAPEDLPVNRTYTVRAIDEQAQRIAVDFVVHGDAGVAGPWAAGVELGERVVFGGPGGAYSPNPDADWHLFAGDESALPAIAAGIESLAADARGVAFIEIADASEQQAIAAPAGVEVRWLTRDGAAAGTSDQLVNAVSAYEWPAGKPHVFAHGERETVKKLRDVFFKDHGLERAQVSISGYWAYGRDDAQFRAEKALPIGQILPPETAASH